MLHYHQIEFLTYERQAEYCAEAEQRRLVQSLSLKRSYRIIGWVGQQLIRWSQTRQGQPSVVPTPATPSVLA